MPRGRIPRPWYRAFTRSWYVTLDGKRIPLGRDKREAHAEFARLMTARGRSPNATSRITVFHLAELWLQNVQRTMKPQTLKSHKSRAQSLVDALGTLQARDLKPFHVTEWVAKHPGWSKCSERSAMTVAKSIMSWGVEQGYLEANPLARLKSPGATRRQPITVAEAEEVISRCPEHIQIALRLLALTGMRPGELCGLSLERIEIDQQKAQVTGKTGNRAVYLSNAAVKIVKPIAQSRQTGPVLQSNNRPLSLAVLEREVRAARGSLTHVRPHSFRGLYATEAIRRGVDALLVSKLLGHRDASVLARHYAAPDEAMLRQAAERAAQPIGTTPDTPRGRQS